MAKIKISEEKFNEAYRCLWDLKDSLIGISGLLTQGSSNNPCYSNEEIYGLGILIKKMSEEVSKVEKLLGQKAMEACPG